ncbi:hypothetical protein EVAR_80836_1 [Eumeta japonica]|uniref:DUF5641 domain-containing protein n=1 Tax=Eumeta variegata TaxID=151549 RepID=A0A4C1V0N8_EUMVA|nr:hypothetical protein EVAR_80836_1 [Eumeta japonica]
MEEVLHTLLLEAAHIVNYRSLTEVNTELTETEGVIPNHFLIGRLCGAVVLKGYLPALVPGRMRGDPICRAPAEGNVALIVDQSLPRYSWPREKINNTYPDSDNQVRMVDVETTRGVLWGPTYKVVVVVSSEAAAAPCPED